MPVAERALTLTGITLDGVALPLAEVLADVVIRHGRTGYYDAPSTSTAQITCIDVARSFSAGIKMGAKLVVTCDAGAGPLPRFTGRVTDATLDRGDLTIVACGKLSEMSGYYVAPATYSKQTWTEQLKTVFQNAQTGNSRGSFPLDIRTPKTNPLMAPVVSVVSEEPNFAQFVETLLGWMGAAMADMPDGKILIQPASARTTANAVNIPPEEVLYTPQWHQTLPGANRVRIDAADRLDFPSENQFGERFVEYDTTIDVSDVNDAYYLRDEMLGRQAWPEWVIESAVLLFGRVLEIGQPVRMSGFSASAPHGTWVAIVEGWTDRITSDGGDFVWTMELALSDPKLSGIGEQPITWNDTPSDLTWANANQTTAWNDALTVDDLYP